MLCTRKWLQRGLYGVLAGLAGMGSLMNNAPAAGTEGCCLMEPWIRVKNASAGNGIAVDPPKVFDNRSLLLRLEQFNAQLSRLTALDQSKLTQGIGSLQGMRATEVARSLSVSTLPLPGTELVEQRDPQSNQLIPEKRTTTSGAFSPTAPALPNASLPEAAPGGYGMAAPDILSDEVNLYYQILNLQTLLEGSITDRTHKDSRGNAGPRAQAVLGFQVSLDPLRQHKNYAAIVEVEVSSLTGQALPSLVALMPQAKTYNTAALSKSSTAFGASAVVKVVTIGYSEKHGSESYFLYRDTDTVAFERPASSKLVFGWEFRPVLNRQTVEPGMRQLFAVVALDNQDNIATTSDSGVKIKVRTYWARFDKKNAVISSGPFEIRDDPEATLAVPSPDSIQNSLGAQIEKVEMKTAGEGTVQLDVLGNNFYSGTTAIVGDKIFDVNNPAFLIKDNHLLQMTVSALDLANGGAIIRGRYGLSADVIDKSADATKGTMPDPFLFSVTFPAVVEKGNNSVTLKLYATGGANAPDLKNRSVIVAIGQQGFVLDHEAWRANPDSLETHVNVKSENLQEGTPATALIPFVPARYSRISLSTPVAVDNVVLLADGDPQVWGITGRGFVELLLKDANTVVTADKDYKVGNGLQMTSQNLLQISVPKARASTVKNVLIRIAASPTVILAAPKAAATPPKATFDASPVPAAAANSAPLVEFAGKNLDQVSKVSFGTATLLFNIQDDGNKLSVFLNRDVTGKPGRVSLAVETKQGTVLAANVDVQ